jgi:hypothetical protein
MCNKVLALIGLVLMMSQAFASKPIDYIYIDASEGNASGGHVAIRFDADVYHYQYVDPGLIKLEKQAVNDFEFNYRFLENRSLYLSQLAVSDQTYSQLRDYFDSRFQIQQQHYALSTELKRERMLLQFLSGKPISVPALLQLSGAGFFYSEQDFNEDSDLSSLGQIEVERHSDQIVLSQVQQKIQIRFNRHYVKQQLQHLVERIKQMRPTPWLEQSIKLQTGQFPKITYSFANRYLDTITEWLALKVIQQQRPLRIHVYRTADVDEFALTTAQQNLMQKFSATLQENILKLLQSSRPDKGQALLVNLGRLLVIEKSIQHQRLFVLDNVDDASVIDNLDQPQYHDELLALHQDAKESLKHAKQQLLTKQQNQESIYSQIEWQGNRFLELHKAMQEKVPVHLYGMKRIPDKSLALPELFKPNLSIEQLNTEIQNLQKITTRYQEGLDGLYRYNLLQRNCVTELFETINQAVSSGVDTRIKQYSTEQLGGYVSVESGSPNFIPFISNQAVQNQYKVSEQRMLPSYRLQQLQKQYSQKNKLSVFFRESNTFSSTLYKPNLSDSFFVFFTDAHPLLRPIYGAVNTLAGLSQSVLGLFTLPFDAGQRLHSGASGLIMSLPELAFFNMRKGSFKYVSYRAMLAADETIVRKARQDTR